MRISEAISDRILELCRERDITPNKLGRLSGLDPSTITSIFYGKSKNPGVVPLLYICDGLNISLAEFFNTDIFKSNTFED